MNGSLLIGLLNSTPVVRKLAAAVLSLCMIGVALVILWLPFHLLGLAEADLIEKRQQLGRLEQVLSTAETFTTLPIGSSTSVFLAGTGEGGMQANLQRRLTALMRDKRQNLAAVGPVAAFESEGIRYVGITANVSGSHAELSNLIFELETSTPPLLIRSAKLSARQLLSSSSIVEEQNLQAQLAVFGAVDPKGSE